MKRGREREGRGGGRRGERGCGESRARASRSGGGRRTEGGKTADDGALARRAGAGNRSFARASGVGAGARRATHLARASRGLRARAREAARSRVARRARGRERRAPRDETRGRHRLSNRCARARACVPRRRWTAPADALPERRRASNDPRRPRRDRPESRARPCAGRDRASALDGVRGARGGPGGGEAESAELNYREGKRENRRERRGRPVLTHRERGAHWRKRSGGESRYAARVGAEAREFTAGESRNRTEDF